MIKLIWICQNDLRPLPKKVMKKKNIKGRITFVEVSTEELIDFFVQNMSAEIETSGGITRWIKYDAYHKQIGITDNIAYDWYTLDEFRQYFGRWYWNFFIM